MLTILQCCEVLVSDQNNMFWVNLILNLVQQNCYILVQIVQ